MKLLQIFKPGRHTALNGAVINFSAADLQATAAAYDPAKYEAPLVVGHPKLADPAYGWAKSLSFSEALEAEPDQVDPAFAEMVTAGRFKKISASFYTPDATDNPVPGVYYLRHIGFLGARPPAVKGLRNASFADAGKGVLEFADWDDMQNASLWRQMREWLIAKFGLDEADKVVPGYMVDNLQTSAAQESDTSTAPSYSESQRRVPALAAHKETQVDKAEAAQLEADNKALAKQVAEFSERENKVKADEAKQRRAAIVSFVEGLVKDGKALPVFQSGLVDLMAALPAETVIEFGEGDKKESLPSADWFKKYLAGQPKIVDFAERGRGGADHTRVEFAAPANASVDSGRLEIHSKALAYQTAHKTDYVTAVKAVGGA